jgi:hypothetical protein
MTDALVEAFIAAFTGRGGIVHRVTDEDAARATVQQICAGPVVADEDPVLSSLCAGLDRVDDPWLAATGVTTVVAASAATGTLALAFDADHPRRTALVPPVHVAVVPVERLVPTYADALAALDRLRPRPSGMRMVSGPSSSGDIEMISIRGMHGPVAVHAVFLRTEPSSG